MFSHESRVIDDPGHVGQDGSVQTRRETPSDITAVVTRWKENGIGGAE
jgi:hypothetical protein